MNRILRGDQAWKIVLNELKNPKDVQLIRQSGKGTLWIHASSASQAIQIMTAKFNSPSSSAKPRAIGKDEFMSIYYNYYPWRTGEMSREQAKGNSRNSSYIFALIHRFCDKSFGCM